jgi:DNA-directed RNA polymerases I, II, and III subunit RPABC3
MDTDEAGQVFNDTFKVTAVDPDGKKFDRVSRLVCTGNTYGMKLTIDVHSEFFRCKTDDQIVMSLNTTIKPNGEASADYYEPPKGPTLLDDYEYAMHGQVFHFEDKEENNVAVYVSYGGLLMRLEGNRRDINSGIKKNAKLYCLLRKHL